MPRIKGEITSAEFLRLAKEKPTHGSAVSSLSTSSTRSANKYGAIRTTNEHGVFDSKREARWVETLIDLQSRGVVDKVETDKRALRYALDVNGVRVGDYTADAKFVCLRDWPLELESETVILKAGKEYVCDAKSKGTKAARDWPLRRNLMFALFRIKILEL